MKKNNLILIGYMGCGKTSVGSCLARTGHRSFLDTDKLIEEKSGISINQIFEKQGEEAFRDMETDCLKELLEKKTEATVISVGGGLPLREKNRGLLSRLGKVIYLRARPETIYERVKTDTTRPLLKTPDPEKRIREMLKNREPYYRDAAEVVIEVDNKSIKELIEEIEALQSFE